MINTEQNNACGFEAINVVGDVADESLNTLLSRFGRFSEVIGVTDNAFTFKGHSVLTICDEMSLGSHEEGYEIRVTTQSNESDIAFLWGAMASRENDLLAKHLLYAVISPEDSGPILNRRWGMIEKSIESMVNGILKSAIQNHATKEGLVHLKEVISEIAWSKSNSDAMMMSKPIDRVIPVLVSAYNKATQESLSEDSAMAITALLSMRNECFQWMFTTHKHNKTITSPSDFLFRLTESERLSGDEVTQIHDFAIGGLISHRVFLETGEKSNIAKRFLPTDNEYSALKDKVDAAIFSIGSKEKNEKVVRRIR